MAAAAGHVEEWRDVLHPRPARSASSGALLLVVASCADLEVEQAASDAGAPGGADTSPDAGRLPGPGDDFAVDPPEPPAPPEPVRFDCPEGWRGDDCSPPRTPAV